MQWIITADHVEDDKRHMGHCSFGWLDSLDAPHEFQIYDDDGNLYYEGKATEIDTMPLDDFAGPNAGATDIRFKNADGEFESIN
jgi:hypothetical protein